MINNFQHGKIIKGIGGFYTIAADNNNYVVKAKNKFRHKGIRPTVGDNVLFSAGQGEQNGWLEEILPRKNILVRPPVANIDCLLIVISPAPKPDYLMVDMLLVVAFKFGIKPILVFNKCDITDSEDFDFSDYNKLGIEQHSISARENIGTYELKQSLKNVLVCIAGQSGVGKTTIINAILGSELETGEISKIDRGRHTTRSVELMENDGISIFDTPGFSMLSLLDDMEAEDIQNYYPEFKEHIQNCKFSPCYHVSEPECEVVQAVENCEISQGRWERYKKLVEVAKEKRRHKYD